MRTVLDYVAMRAGIPKIPQEAAEEIVKDSNGNMRKAILVLEALKMQTYADSSTYVCHETHPRSSLHLLRCTIGPVSRAR